MLSQQWTASHPAAAGDEPLQVWEGSQGSWDAVASQELGSLSTHPGRLFAALMHLAELDA